MSLTFCLLNKEAVALIENYFCCFHPTSSKCWKKNKDYCCNVCKLPNTPLLVLLYLKWILIFYGITLFKLLSWGCQLHISTTDSTLSLFNNLPFLQICVFLHWKARNKTRPASIPASVLMCFYAKMLSGTCKTTQSSNMQEAPLINWIFFFFLPFVRLHFDGWQVIEPHKRTIQSWHLTNPAV